jgi:hypothetical protein
VATSGDRHRGLGDGRPRLGVVTIDDAGSHGGQRSQPLQ